MKWIKQLFSKKKTNEQCDIHVVTKRFDFGQEFIASGIRYKYLYTQFRLWLRCSYQRNWHYYE